MNLLVPFLTGLTAGGLNCLAVQGALLASTLAYQVELDMHSQSANQKFRPRLAQPIILFLTAKLVAYTLLGFVAGGLGSFFMLTPMTRAVLMVAIGIFMLGNGLRMLKVHPIFRYFVIEPPASLTRYIRRKSKNGASIFTPIFMGTLTVLLPCGISQSMIALALGTGNPYQGAAILFAFTLGTIPVFFGVSYFATRLGASMEKYFNRLVAIVIIILAFVSINSGLNLAGSPYSFTNLFMGGGSPLWIKHRIYLPLHLQPKATSSPSRMMVISPKSSIWPRINPSSSPG